MPSQPSISCGGPRRSGGFHRRAPAQPGRRGPALPPPGGPGAPGGEAARYGPLLLLGAELLCSRLRGLLGRAREDAAGTAELRDYLAEQESEKGMDLLEPALLRKYIIFH